MKTLLYNDLKVNLQLVLKGIAISIFIAFFINESMGIFYKLIYGLFHLLVFFKVFKLDSNYKWDIKTTLLPIDLETVVLYRYITSIVYLLVIKIALFTGVILREGRINLDSTVNIWIYLIIFLSNLTFIFPYYFKFSFNEDRIRIFYDYFMVGFLIIFIMSILYYSLGMDFIKRYQILILIIGTLFGFGAYINSYYRSVKNIKNKSFR